jgi:hypothetical protein
MSNSLRKRRALHPSVTDAELEVRLALSSLTPLAAPPVFSNIVISEPGAWKTVGQLQRAYRHQVQLLTLDLRNQAASEILQMNADSTVSKAQQLNDLNATLQGTLDAAALRLSSQAALLPASASVLVPAIQNSLLGTGAKSLSSLIGSALQSSQVVGSEARLQSTVAREILAAPRALDAEFTNYFNTTNVKDLAVNSSGQQIPLEQFMGQQVVGQVTNTLGALAQSLPSVANSMLFPDGTTVNPTQDVVAAFGQQATNALTTAAFQLSSSLAMFQGFPSVVAQIQPLLVGSQTSLNSLTSSLQSLPPSSLLLSSPVLSVFTTSLSSIVAPIDSFLGLQGQSNVTLPTTGFTSPFSSQFTTSSFDGGFNNGFASDTSTGFVGFGSAPSTFNTSFATGFTSVVNGYFTTLLGTVGTNNGMPIVHSE